MLAPFAGWAQEDSSEDDDFLGDEKILEEEQDFPDLIGVDETGEVMDEFAFLEDDIIESAARHRQKIGMSPAAVTVITREDIQATGASTLPDLLRLVPGMDVVIATPFFTSVSSRLAWNYENSGYLVLLDGREANVELLGQPYWAGQPLAVEDIERIEVLRGPASSLYGANAFAGVISITTRSLAEESSTSLRMSAGELGAQAIGGRTTLEAGDWRLSFSGTADMMRSFSDVNSVARRQIWGRALIDYRLDEDSKLRFEGSYSYAKGILLVGAGSFPCRGILSILRASYESPDLRGQIYWRTGKVGGRLKETLSYEGITLAEFGSADIGGNTLNGEVQWTLPELWEPLMLMIGGGGRISRADDENLYDADSYDDINSPDYHRLGLVHWEARSGAFIHAELAPSDWVTVTAGLRIDYNTETGPFLSPRAAAVFQPLTGQFLRLSAARAFRKPSFVEDELHFPVTFPEESPIQLASAQERFHEFMSHNIGGEDLHNEELVSLEAGYRGEFLDRQLTVALDAYINWYTEITYLLSDIVLDQNGLPDLDLSSFKFGHLPEEDTRLIGGELVVRYSPWPGLALLFSWAYREAFNIASGLSSGGSPKNFLTLGGRLKTDWGLIASVYLFTRSEFTQSNAPNPEGILAPYQFQHFDNIITAFARLGWRANPIEAGIKLFLPVSPFLEPHFRYYEMGGGTTPFGANYGGELLQRYLTVYLEGSF